MTFIWMQALWLLLLTPLLVMAYFWALKRKKAAAIRYANLAVVKQAMGGTSRFRRHIPPILFLCAITVLLLAVARPAAIMTLASKRATILMALDVSGSLRGAEVDPNRIVAAQKAAKAFVKGQPRDVRIGIVAFAGTAFLVQPPTTNRDDLNTAIDRFELQRGTAVGSGILVSLQTIFPQEQFDLSPWGGGGRSQDFYPEAAPLGGPANAQAKKAPPEPVAPGSYQSALIILMTDGQTTTGADPIEAAKTAADHGVRVFTVGFGSTDGQVVGFGGRFMRAQLDEESLKQIADRTKAQYFRASTSAELEKVYKNLNTKLMKETRETEITAIFAAIAAVLAMAAAGLSMLWFNRLM